QCMKIPAVPDFKPPAGHRACSHAAHEAAGLVWVRLEEGASARPEFGGEDDPHLRKLTVGPYHLASSAPRLLEDFPDLSHFGFVHEGILGDRAHTAQAAYQVESTARGLVATGCRAWQPQSNRLSTEGSHVEYTYEVPAPYTAVLTKLPQAQDG